MWGCAFWCTNLCLRYCTDDRFPPPVLRRGRTKLCLCKGPLLQMRGLFFLQLFSCDDSGEDPEVQDCHLIIKVAANLWKRRDK